jgi:acrylyl-CoA reductase (NADPH)
MAPREVRQPAWDRLARDLDAAALERISKVVGLAEVQKAAEEIIAGKIKGRIVVDVNR